MKKVLCRIAWAILLLFAAVEHTSADSKKDYKEFADATRKRIWAMDMPQFKKHDCPAKYKTESAIILANYRDVEMVRSAKFSWGTLMRQGQSFKLRKLYCNDLHRVLIYINDDVALKRFSEFDYRTTTTGYSNNGWREKGKVVLGVRIVKPDGTIKEINDAAEFTLRQSITKNERANLVFGVKVAVDNTSGILKPGMPADVELGARHGT